LIVRLAAETWLVLAKIAVARTFAIYSLRWSKSSSEWAVGDETDAEAATGVEHAVFGVATPQRVFALQRTHGWTAWARSIVADEAQRCRGVGPYRPRPGSSWRPRSLQCRRFDQRDAGSRGDHLDTQAPQRGVARFGDVLRCAVDADEGSVGGALVTELRGEHDLVTTTLDGASTSSSFLKGPYMSAVSRKSTPASNAS